MSSLASDFVERRVSLMVHVPDEWTVAGESHFYLLDLKMCEIKQLKYKFRWGSTKCEKNARSYSIIQMPHRILSIDLSLNDLESLDQESLTQFTQLRMLNASLNRIQSFLGVEVLKNLMSLNLSHNAIKHVHGLQELKQLTQLNLGMNQIEDLSCMPILSNLRTLHLNNNKLRSLQGIQALANIQELYGQHNEIVDLLPVASSLRLRVLDVSHNQVSSLFITIEVLRELHRLDSLSLIGNPVEKENNYQSKIMQSTSLHFLDNVAVNPQLKGIPSTNTHFDNMVGIKEAARQAFLDHLQDEKMKSDENCRFLQERLNNVKGEFKEMEEKTYRDMDACMRYLDSLSLEEAQVYSFQNMRDRLRTHSLRPWHQSGLPSTSFPNQNTSDLVGNRQLRGKTDYSGIHDADEVLRHAYNELVKDQHISSD